MNVSSLSSGLISSRLSVVKEEERVSIENTRLNSGKNVNAVENDF
jgi:hypothetical protein